MCTFTTRIIILTNQSSPLSLVLSEFSSLSLLLLPCVDPCVFAWNVVVGVFIFVVVVVSFVLVALALLPS